MRGTCVCLSCIFIIHRFLINKILKKSTKILAIIWKYVVRVYDVYTHTHRHLRVFLEYVLILIRQVLALTWRCDIKGGERGIELKKNFLFDEKMQWNGKHRPLTAGILACTIMKQLILHKKWYKNSFVSNKSINYGKQYNIIYQS